MPQLIQFDNTGSRSIDVPLGENVFRMRTYFLPYISRWLLDITDTQDNPIIMGICLNTGVENLIKGKSELFDGQAIRCVSIDGSENNTPDSLGTTCFVIYYEKGEVPTPMYKDKMLD